MNLYRPTFYPRQILQSTALRAARAAALVTTCLVGTIGMATAGASTLLAASPAMGTLTFTPASASFGSVELESRQTITVTITNTGSASVSISGTSVSGAEFSVTGLTTPKTLAAGASVTVTATFTPTSGGAASGTFNITSNALFGTVKYPLSGTGVASALTATPGSVWFGGVTVGTTNSQTIQLKNASSQTVLITRTSISLPGSQFHTSGLTLPLRLTAGATTHLNLAFTPSVTGYVMGSLTVSMGSPNVPLVIAISGNGIVAARAITATPTSLDFGSEMVGKTHLLTASLINTGNSGVTVSGITVSDADFTTSGGVDGVTLAAGQSATLNVIYEPKTASKQSGTVKISSNATNSPATITVTGTGVSATVHSVALTWGASSSTGIIGYYVYRSTTSGSGFAQLVASPLSGLQYTDGAVQSGTTYYYKVTTVNSAGQESTSTAEVKATIP